ncbi:multicopper oxidase domain-containing protein [Streptomyces sp. M19]
MALHQRLPPPGAPAPRAVPGGLPQRQGPAAADVGWKDTVDVRPYEVVEVLARFHGYKGRYMFHCHNLEHEDMAMMANFDVV